MASDTPADVKRGDLVLFNARQLQDAITRARAKENEACARLAEQEARNPVYLPAEVLVLRKAADLIRARTQP